MSIITICGSMKFSAEMIQLARKLEKMNYTVFLPDVSEDAKKYETLSKEEQIKIKRSFIDQHFSKIAKSDAVLIANYKKKGIEGYIGSNTLMEIGYAYGLEKEIFLLHETGNQPCKEEVDALAHKILSGNIVNL